MDPRITEITSALTRVAEDARAEFGSLSAEQLNWKPAAASWSVGQCFEHLIKTNEQFYPEFEKLASGTRKNTIFQTYSPFTGMLGRFLIKAVTEDSKKTKAPSKAIVPPSDISADVIDRFATNIGSVNLMIERCADLDRKKTIVSSPFLKVFTYTLEDAYTVLVEHVKRHFRQAKRVTEAEGFPQFGVPASAGHSPGT